MLCPNYIMPAFSRKGRGRGRENRRPPARKRPGNAVWRTVRSLTFSTGAWLNNMVCNQECEKIPGCARACPRHRQTGSTGARRLQNQQEVEQVGQKTGIWQRQYFQPEGRGPGAQTPCRYLWLGRRGGLCHSIFEILSNSIDEAREGYGEKILLTRFADGSIQVEDFGRGIPADYNPKEQRYNWELVFCEMYAGGKYSAGEDNYEYSLGLNGLACVPPSMPANG